MYIMYFIITEYMEMEMKPLGKKAYGHIAHMSGSRMGPADKKCHKGQEKIGTEQARDYKDLIIVQEKLDGSNCSIAKINGKLFSLTRSGYEAKTSPFKQHHIFDKWVNKHYSRFDGILDDNERISGEWLLEAHGTRYDLQHEPFVVFDMFRNNERITYLELMNISFYGDLILPNLLHIGQPIKLKHVLKKIEKSGHGAIDPVEGAVWRIEREGKVDFLFKYVRPEKEDGIYMDKGIYNCKIKDLL